MDFQKYLDFGLGYGMILGMKRDWTFLGYYGISPEKSARMAVMCDNSLFINTDEGIWDCPRCHYYIISIGKPKEPCWHCNWPNKKP